MEELKKRRDDLTRELIGIRVRAEKINVLLREVETHILNGIYAESRREEEK